MLGYKGFPSPEDFPFSFSILFHIGLSYTDVTEIKSLEKTRLVRSLLEVYGIWAFHIYSSRTLLRWMRSILLSGCVKLRSLKFRA